jgi:uncharacterized repeat protein (TIGR03843 family)
VTAAPSSAPGAQALELLTHGRIEVEGRMAAASNATLYAEISWQGESAHCIYKPTAGERPLWDFPEGTLSKREVAAYEVSAATGWDVVPPTVWREGPFGEGSVQLWIDALDDDGVVDVRPPDQVPPGWLTVLEAEGARGEPVLLCHADDPRLARMAVFDAVIDNGDRKGGHILLDTQGHLWGVDHGVSFNLDEKLRTVLWGFAGAPLGTEATEVLHRLRGQLAGEGDDVLRAALRPLLAPAEVRRLRTRVDRLLDAGIHPAPRGYGPAIPWPPW